jgi:DNA-binding transcriptional ArsR family regulator
VNISSKPKKEIRYPIPEFSEILQNLRKIKREVSEFGRTNSETDYNKILKRFDQLEQSILIHSRKLSKLEQALVASANTKLTEKQRTILKWLTLQYEGSEVYTNLINKISNELDIPESTVRWNMRGLREAELIEAGTKENKGIPVSLTTMGRIMANYTEPMD